MGHYISSLRQNQQVSHFYAKPSANKQRGNATRKHHVRVDHKEPPPSARHTLIADGNIGGKERKTFVI